MPTNLELDDGLIEEVRQMGKHKTKREAVNAAMVCYRKWLQRVALLECFGKVDFDPKYDYKAERRRR